MKEAIKSGLGNAPGIMLSLPKKQEVMVHLKQLMQEGRLHIPYDPELINEMNGERYELTKTGQMQFSHPSGTHDDRLWGACPRGLRVQTQDSRIPSGGMAREVIEVENWTQDGKTTSRYEELYPKEKHGQSFSGNRVSLSLRGLVVFA